MWTLLMKLKGNVKRLTRKIELIILIEKIKKKPNLSTKDRNIFKESKVELQILEKNNRLSKIYNTYTKYEYGS